MRAPFGYYGGKAKLARRIVSLIPPHKIYVEVFGGAANVLFAKPPSAVEVYNDIYPEVVNFFRIVQDTKAFAEFYRLVSLTPFSREEMERCRAELGKGENVERAWRFFVAVAQGFGGKTKATWSYTVQTTSRQMAAVTARWLSKIERLPSVHARIMRVTIENSDFRDIIPKYDSPQTFFYLDPPHIPSTRISPNVYPHELDSMSHRDLVSILLNIQGMAILSGYRHPIYEPLERAGWKRLDRAVPCTAGGTIRGRRGSGPGATTAYRNRVESVWISPNCFAEAA